MSDQIQYFHDSLNGISSVQVSDSAAQCTTCGSKRRCSSPPFHPSATTAAAGDEAGSQPKKRMLQQPIYSDTLPGFTKASNSCSSGGGGRFSLRRSDSDPCDKYHHHYLGSDHATFDFGCGSGSLKRWASDRILLSGSTENGGRRTDLGLGGSCTTPNELLLSPNSSKLKMMKEKMEEMSKRWEEVLQEEDQEDEDYYYQCPEEEEEEEQSSIPQDEGSEETEKEPEEAEAVSLERIEEGCSKIKFKCHCGKGYQVLTFNGSCYYRLL